METSKEDRDFYAAYIRANSGHYPYDSPAGAGTEADPLNGDTEMTETDGASRSTNQLDPAAAGALHR